MASTPVPLYVAISVITNMKNSRFFGMCHSADEHCYDAETDEDI